MTSGRCSKPSSARRVEEEFASFDWEPLAAASIGQTHRATLHGGERVVVKVQRPGIEDTVARDAAVLRMVASVLERRVEVARQVGVRGLADELIGSLQRELDYTAEATNAEAFRSRRGEEVGVSHRRARSPSTPRGGSSSWRRSTAPRSPTQQRRRRCQAVAPADALAGGC